MRHTAVVALALLAAFAAVSHAQTPAPGKEKPRQADASVPYPTEVALVNEPPRGYTYRQSPNRLPLYTWDKDSPGKSTCYDGCDTEWIPLLAPSEAKPLGEWTLVTRKDGKRQWAYRKRPVYMLVHDSAEAPIGDGTNGEWHLLPHFQ